MCGAEQNGHPLQSIMPPCMMGCAADRTCGCEGRDHEGVACENTKTIMQARLQRPDPMITIYKPQVSRVEANTRMQPEGGEKHVSL